MNSDPRADRNRLIEVARAMGEDYTLADIYARSAAGGRPVGQDPREQENNDQGIDWLNAAGLGALAAGLTAGGIAGYRNRGRLASMMGRGGGRPPEAPNSPPGGPGPMPGPRSIAAQRVPQAVPTAPWNIDAGVPTGGQGVDPRSQAILERLRNSVPNTGVDPWTRLSEERARINEMRSQPSAQGVQMVDLNAPVSVAPSDSGAYQVNQRPIEQQSAPLGAQNVVSNVDLRRSQAGMPTAAWNTDLGTPVGNQVVDLKALAELEQLRNSVPDSNVDPWTGRRSPGDIWRDDSSQNGATSFEGLSDSSRPSDLWRESDPQIDSILQMFEDDPYIQSAYEAGGKAIIETDPQTGNQFLAEYAGTMPEAELARAAEEDGIRLELENDRRKDQGTRAQQAAKQLWQEGRSQNTTIGEAMDSLQRNRFEQDKNNMIEAVQGKALGERVNAPRRRNMVPGMIELLAENGYGTPSQFDENGKLVSVASIDPDLVSQLIDYRNTGRRPRRMRKEVADLLGISSTKGDPYIYDDLPEELMQGMEEGVNITRMGDGEDIPRAKDSSNIGEYGGMEHWPQTLQDAIYDTSGEKWRVKRDNLLGLYVSAPKGTFDEADAMLVAAYENSAKDNWKNEFRNVRQQLRSVENSDDQKVLQSRLNELMAIPQVQRPFYGSGKLAPPDVIEAQNRMTAIANKEFFANDPNGTIAKHILSGGELQDLTKKGGMYTEGEDPRKTRRRNVRIDGNGNVVYTLSDPISSARRSPSDLEAVYELDGETGFAKDLGILPGEVGDTDLTSGLGRRQGNVIGFAPRDDIAGFAELPGTNASGVLEPDLVDPDSLYSTGAEEYAYTKASTRMSDDIEIVGRVTNADDDLSYAYGLADYGKPTVSPEEDFLGDYIGGIIGFFKGNDSKYVNTPGVELAPIYKNVQEAREAGAIKKWNPGNPYSVEQPSISSKLFYADEDTLVNADYAPKDRKHGFIDDGTARNAVAMNAMIEAKKPREAILTHDINLLSKRFNNEAQRINRLLDRGFVETTAELTGTPDLGPEFRAAVQDGLENPKYVRELFTNSGDKKLASLPLPVEYKNGEKVPLGLVRSLMTSGGRSYTQPVAVQMPRDARINDGLSALLAVIAKNNGGITAQGKARLAGMPKMNIQVQNNKGEMRTEQINPSLNPEGALREINRSIYDSLVTEDPNATKESDRIIPADVAERTKEMESKLSELIAIINQDGNISSKQEDQLIKGRDTISDLAQYLPISEDYNKDAALMRVSRPADDTPLDMVQAYDYNVKESWRKGVFPPKATLSDAKDYNVAVPVGGSEDTYQYQMGKSVNNPQLWAGVQLSQLDAQKNVTNTAPARIKALDTAIAASNKRGYRYAGRNPIEETAKTVAATIPQLSAPGYKLNIQRAYIPKDPSNPMDRGYAGGDTRETVSSYGVDEASRLATQIQGMRANLDPADPQYQQLIELESSVLKDAAASKPPGRGALTPLARVETDPDYAAKIYRDLEPKLLPTRLGVPAGSQSGRIRVKSQPQNMDANMGMEMTTGQLTSMGQQLIDQVKSRREAEKGENKATARPGKRAAMQGAPAQTVMEKVREQENVSDGYTTAYGGDIGAVSVDPVSSIARRRITAIQNPGGDYKSEVTKLGQQLKANRQGLRDVAYQSPLGEYVLQPRTYNLGSLGSSPGDQGFKPLYNDSGKIIGELVEDKDMGIRREVVFSPAWLANATSTVRGNLPDLTPRLGPGGMTATQTMDAYGLTPDQITGTMTSLMGQARDDANRDARNRQALAQATRNYNNRP